MVDILNASQRGMPYIRSVFYGLGICSLAIGGGILGLQMTLALGIPTAVRVVAILILEALLGGALFTTHPGDAHRGAATALRALGAIFAFALWAGFTLGDHGQYAGLYRSFAVFIGAFPGLVRSPYGEAGILRLRMVSNPRTSAERGAGRRLELGDRFGSISTIIIAVVTVALGFGFGVLAYAIGVTLVAVVCAFVALRERSILSEATTAFFRASA